MTRYYSSTAAEATLSGGINASVTAAGVSTVAGWPTSVPFTAVIDVGGVSEEIVTVTGVAGTNLTIVRGEDGSAALSHLAGVKVRHMLTARDLREPQAHMDASTVVHGLTGAAAVVGTDTAQTLTNKTLSGASNTFTLLPQQAGEIVAWPTATAPARALLCDGAAVSRTTYANLFAVIGTVFGVGDGSTTFNVPNLKGRVVVMQDVAQTEFDVVGEVGGEKTHLLTSAEMPSHNHVQDAHNHTQNSHNHTQNAHGHTQNSHNHAQNAHGHTNYRATGYAVGGASTALWPSSTADPVTTATDSTTATNQAATATNNDTTATNQAATATNAPTTATNQATGGDTAHNNLQPYMVLNYIIRT